MNFYTKVCINLLNRYREIYNETVESMKENENEIAWNCSSMFIFGVMDRFMTRLEKVRFYFNYYFPI